MNRVACLLALTLLPALAESGEANPAALKKAIDQILDQPAFASAFWAAEIRSLETGRVLYERNARKNMTPASTMKLVTTAAALDAFGPDYRIRTTLESAGRLDASGRILGDVFLVGRGDPALSEKGADGRTAFDAFADALLAAGVRRIEGRLVGHEGLFKDRRPQDWEWSDLVWCYGAEVSALAWNDNCATLTVSGGRARRRAGRRRALAALALLFARRRCDDLAGRHCERSQAGARAGLERDSALWHSADRSGARGARDRPRGSGALRNDGVGRGPRGPRHPHQPRDCHFLGSPASRCTRTRGARQPAAGRDPEGRQQAQQQPACGNAAAPGRGPRQA